MSFDSIKSKLQEKQPLLAGMNAKIAFDFGDDGFIFVDATQNPPVISDSSEEPDVAFTCSAETFENILNGTQDPTMAYMMGKLKVKGSMGLAMKLNSILED